VVVGRSNEENDFVTHRLAKQEDYWFHASGVPGSHVVLKRAGRKDNPSSKAIEEAAAIAAFYSKSRNSRKAPVIYTLKKYVHKPRKAKPGLATCSNEKTVMVAPMNPEEGITPEWIAED
jgi:predicted ribosome quality control (RQC) complex YloA/Tae2 family protein